MNRDGMQSHATAPAFAEGRAARHPDFPVSSHEVPLPLFSVATHKFIVLSICTFGIYEAYWCYQNWKRIKARSREYLSPFWRAVFAPLWGFSLFDRIHAAAKSAGVPVAWNATLLAASYFVLSASWRLPDPWWLLSFATVISMLPVQQAAQRINEIRRHETQSTESRNDNYTIANAATIAIGGSFLLLVVIGTFMPE